MTVGHGNQLGQYVSMAAERINYWTDNGFNGKLAS